MTSRNCESAPSTPARTPSANAPSSGRAYAGTAARIASIISSASSPTPGRKAGAISGGHASPGRSASIVRAQYPARLGSRPHMRLIRPALLLLPLLLFPGSALAATAPGAPGQKTVWAEADKDGFGTATTTRSKVWHTLDDGVLTEVYYPNLGTPSVRDLQLIVSDGRTFSHRERGNTRHRTVLTDPRSLTYRQVNRTARYRITKTYVTDPARNALVIDVRFRSLTGKKLALYALYDPALSNNGDDDRGSTRGKTLLAHDGSSASAMLAAPAFRRTSNGYLGTSDGWQDLRSDHRMNWHYRSARKGNVVQTGQTRLDGVKRRHMTLVLGFRRGVSAARSTARAALDRGFASASRAYATGWHRYLAGKPRPASARALRT